MKRGFTLIELMVVLAIVALLMAVAVPKLSTAGKTQAALAPERVAALARSLGSLAAARGKSFTLLYDPSANKVRVRASDGSILGPPYELALPPGVTASPIGDWWTFDSAGRVVSGGEVVVGSKRIAVTRWGDVSLR